MTLGFRRWAPLLIAPAIAAGPFAVPAAAAASPCGGAFYVHVSFADSAAPPSDVCPDTIGNNADVHGVTYRFRNENGTPTSDTVSGMSLGKLVSIASNSQVTSPFYVLVQRQDGTRQALTAGELADPSTFQDPQLQPVIAFRGAGNIDYLRPLRSDSDDNADDRVDPALTSDGAIDVEVHTKGRVLDPVVTEAHAGKVLRAKQPATFTASTTQDLTAPTYEWRFTRHGDPVEDGASTKHRYPVEGTFAVIVAVTATDPDGGTDYGESEPRYVTVGPAGAGTRPKDDNGPPSNGGARHRHRTGVKRSANPRGDGETPHQNPADQGTSNSRTGNGPAGTTGRGGSAPGAGTSTSAPQGSTRVAQNPSSSRGRSNRTAAGGAFVEGVSIEQHASANPAARPSTRAQGAQEAQRQSGPTSRLDLRWLWWFAPVLLLAGGSLAERRRPARPGRTQSSS